MQNRSMGYGNFFDDLTAQVVEDNLTGYRDSNSLMAFRKLFPLPTPFTRTVIRLQEYGFSADDARWAAGEASQRLPEGTQFAEMLELALVILEEYRHAA